MTNAVLGLTVQSEQAKGAAVDLDKLTMSAERAETSTQKLATSSRAADTATGQLTQSLTREAASMQSVDNAAGLAAAATGRITAATHAHTAALQANNAAMRMANMQRSNLIFQLNDIGVSLASGMNPLMVFVQQGSQIASIWGPGEGGIGRALSETGRIAVGAITKFWPLAAVVGAVTLGFAAMTTEINRTADTQVSMTDVMLASWELLSEVIMDALDPVFDFFGGLSNAISPHIANAANGIIGMFDLAFKDVKTIWSMLPAALGDSTIQTLNTMMTAIEDFLNQNRMKIAAFMLQVSPALGPFGGQMAAAGGRLAAAPVTFDRLENPLAGAESAFNQQMAQNRLDVMTTDYIGLIGQRAQEIANRPDEDAVKKAAKEAERQAEAYTDLTRGAHQFIAAKELEIRSLGMSAEAASRLRHEQELLNKAANDNIDLTPKQTEELMGLAASMAAAEENLRRMTEVYEFGKDTFRGFFSDLRQGLSDGKNLWESLGNAAANALDKIADKALGMAADGLWDLIFGGISSIFGGGIGGASFGMFGRSAITPLGFGGTAGIYGVPGFANGTPSAPGGWSWVGEKGPELVRLPRGSQVVPHQQSMNMSAANSNKVSVVRIELGEGLRAGIVQEAVGQSVEISGRMVEPVAKAVGRMGQQGRF